jgi:nucleotide-binding universal stress UspA family protein
MQIHEIVYSTDFSPCARHAFEPAVELARRFGARLHVLHVLVPLYPLVLDPMMYAPPAADAFDEVQVEAELRVEELALVAERRGVEVVTALERGAEPAAVLVDYARRLGAGMVVIGTHGRRGPTRLLLGSVAEEVVRHSPCPVLAIRGRKGDEGDVQGVPRRLLVPYDFSPAARGALTWAAGLVRRTGGTITLLHVLEEPLIVDGAALRAVRGSVAARRGALRQLEERLREEGERFAPDVAVTAEVVSGHPAAAILGRAERDGADWLVMATHSRTGLRRLVFGSTAESVLRSARQPVLLVSPDALALELALEPAATHGTLVL